MKQNGLTGRVLLFVVTLVAAIVPQVAAQIWTEVPGCRWPEDLGTVRGQTPTIFRDGNLIAAAGTYAYAANLDDPEIVVVDFTDPRAPIEVTRVATASIVKGLVAADGFLLVAMSNAALVRFDLSDPGLPVADITLPLSGRPRDLILVGDFAYLAMGNLGVMGVTLEYPGFMFPLPSVATGGFVTGVAWENGLLLAADDANGLVIFDAADPADLQYLGSFSVPMTAEAVAAGFGRAVVCGSSVGNYGSTVVFSDITDPLNPRELASRSFEGTGSLSPRALIRSPDRFLVVRMPGNIGVMDFLYDGQELLLHGYSTQLGDRGVVDTGEWLVGVDFYGVNIAPSGGLQPYPLATNDIGRGRAAREGDFLYLAASTGLKILDVSDPLAPTELGELSTPYLSRAPVAVHGSTVYVGGYGAGIIVVDVTDPTTPTVTGNVTAAGVVRALLRDGDLLYGTSGDDGFVVYDLADPAAPVMRGVLGQTDDGDYWPLGMAKWQDQVIVTRPPTYIRVYDVADPDAPVAVQEFGATLHSALACTDDGRLLVGGGSVTGLLTYQQDGAGRWQLLGPSLGGLAPITSLMIEGDVAYAAERQLAMYDLAGGGVPTKREHFEASIQGAVDLISFDETIISVSTRGPAVTLAKQCFTDPSRTRVDLPAPARLLSSPWPNPFNPRTTVAFDLPRAGEIDLAVYDLRGRRLRTLWDGPAPAGTNRVVWDGTDDRGRGVAAGVYLVRILSGDRTEHRKVALIK